ncbi:protein SSUH2 homolog isoform X2 [Chaetodon auriga]|uniref:protein SSUH2 homolog isoform X2 n=1 Tax=Chaetodon auriga TaxID=39042 RepID=UPI004032C0D7
MSAWTHSILSINEDTAREAFALFASSKSCYSSAPAKHGVITSMEAFNTYRYRLETFTESRSMEWSQEPYRGQSVDARTQPPPGRWDIPARTPSFFVDDRQIIKVPHTSSVKSCHICVGVGRKPCTTCAGAGNKVCRFCNGFGYCPGRVPCHYCNGGGRQNCSHCYGQGSNLCGTCGGQRWLLVYIIVIVKWTNNIDHYVMEQSSGLQKDKLRKVSGKKLFRDSKHMVDPVVGFPVPSVVRASKCLVNEHKSEFSQTSRILQQRQTIELIPVTKVTYSWKGKSHLYFVYGNESKVSADNYPATCCCTVM